MSNHMDVLRVDLRTEKTNSNTLARKVTELCEQEKLWLGWMVDEDRVEPDIACFNWHCSFIRDLLYLRDLGVRGHIILLGSEGELIKYEVKEDAVREYDSRVVFRKGPSSIYRNRGDVR